jgi:hypothetical protein
MRPPLQGSKNVLQLVSSCITRAPTLKSQAQALQHDLHQVLRRFGRQCRGQGNIVVQLVRHTDTQL